MENLDHPELIAEWKQDLDAIFDEKYIYKDVKLPSIKKTIIVMIKLNTGQQ